MTAILAFDGYLRVFKDNGDICADAKAQWYVAGSTTPTNTYDADDLLSANANPVSANTLGLFPVMWLSPDVSYKVVITGAGVTTRTIDKVYQSLTLGSFDSDARYIGVPGGATYSSAGSSNAYTVTTGLSLDAYDTYSTFLLYPTFTNTGPATLAVDGLTAKSIFNDGAALLGGEIVSGQPILLMYDGTQYQIVAGAAELVANRFNYLVNSNCSLDSFSGSHTDGTYGLVMWKVYVQTAAVASSQGTTPELTIPYSGRLTQSQATPQRMGIAQFIDTELAKELRGKTVTFKIRVKPGVAASFRAAIIASDSDTMADPVNDWTSTNYTAGNFFISANNATPSVSSSKSLAVNTPGDLIVSATIGSQVQGIYVFLWTEETMVQNGTMDWYQAQLVEGYGAGPFRAEPPSIRDVRAQRFYEQSFATSTVPAQNYGAINAYRFSQIVGAAAVQSAAFIRYRVPKRSGSPTVTIYNPDAANAQIRNVTAGADWTLTSTALTESSGEGFAVSGTTAAGSAAGQSSRFHWSSDAQP